MNASNPPRLNEVQEQYVARLQLDTGVSLASAVKIVRTKMQINHLDEELYARVISGPPFSTLQERQ